MSKYIGKRIVPKHCGEWNRDIPYEMLSIVLHTESGNSFITKREVPAGVEITDTSYWALCSEYNAQIEAYQQAVTERQTAFEKKVDGRMNTYEEETNEHLSQMSAHLNACINTVKEETDSRLTEASRTTAEVGQQLDVLKKQVAENVKASTQSNGDYAAELVDARVDNEGNAYSSVGEAIRGQYHDLKIGNIEPLKDVVRMLPYLIKNNGAIGRIADKNDLIYDKCYVSNINGVLTELGLGDSHTGFLAVNEDDCILYRGYLEGGGRSICAYSDMTEESFIQVILQGQPKNDAQVRTLLLTLPKGTKYIRASCNGRADEFSIYQMAGYTLEDVHEQMTQFMEGYLSWTMDMENRVSDNEYKMGAHYMLVSGNESFPVLPVADGQCVVDEQGKYIDSKGKVSGIAAARDDRYTEFVKVKEKTIYLYQGSTYDPGRCFAFYSDANEESFISSMIPNRQSARKQYIFFETPEGASYARFTFADGNGMYSFALYEASPTTVSALRKLLESFITQTTDSIAGLKNDVNYKDDVTAFCTSDNEELIKGYYMGRDGNPVESRYGDYVTDYIAIHPGTRYLYTGKFSDDRCVCQYSADKKLIKAVQASSLGSGAHLTYAFTSEPSAYFFRASVYGGITAAVPKVSLIEVRTTLKEKVTDVLELVDSINTALLPVEPAPYEYHVPGAIYATENTAANNSAKSNWYARNYVQTLYPESFLYEKLPLLINGQRSWNVKGTRKSQDVVEKETVSLQMGGPEELKSCNLSFQMIKTANSVLKGKTVRYLPIGDSMLGNTIPDNCGEYSIGWNHSAEAKRFAVLDATDLGIEDNFCCLGTCHAGTKAKFSYQGADFTMKACDEGRGSWTTANYLRHCIHTTTTASGSGSGFHNKIAWDSLGLGRKTPYGEEYSEEAAYEEYSYSTEQRKMIQRTPHGYYHWDYSQELWTFLKQKHPSSFTGLSVYSGTDSDRAAIDDAMEYLLTHPDNPFFDWETAKRTGSYGFSLLQYLERYRTLDDDGTTRLTVGETAGSQISSKNIGVIDVCTPTHVTIELGENDRWWFPNDPAQTVSDVLLMMQAIHSEYPDIYVGFLTTRMMGVFYPEKWNDRAIIPAMSVASNKFKYSVNEQIWDELGSVDDQDAQRSYVIPTYEVHSALSFQKTRKDVVLSDGEEILIGISGDINHPGPEANATMGYQILSWIYYTLAQQ